MTTTQLNAEMLRNMSIIVEDENLLKRAEKQSDPTEFTREEFFARIDEAKNGSTFELGEDETLEDLINRLG